MMRACAELGHSVALVTLQRPAPQATADLNLALNATLNGQAASQAPGIRYTSLQERYRSFWGVDKAKVAALAEAESAFSADAVVLAGLDALPYLPGVRRAVRVWYAADEWVWHHLSLMHATAPATWSNLRVAAIKGLYERAYASLIDRAWVVSTTEQRAMRWFAGVRDADVVPNGVDAEYFAPSAVNEQPWSAVFWGRLDFEPNIQGLQWFCRNVWPELKARTPDATFTIVGFNPGAEVLALREQPGIQLKPNLEDLRDEVQRHAIVVLPFVSGGGIKNKLLEAAAMQKAIVCTSRTLGGLRNPSHSGLVVADDARTWVDTMGALWASPEKRREQSTLARRWVVTEHSWAAAAAHAVSGIQQSLEARRP